MAALKDGGHQIWQQLPAGVYPSVSLLWCLKNLKPDKRFQLIRQELCNLPFFSPLPHEMDAIFCQV